MMGIGRHIFRLICIGLTLICLGEALTAYTGLDSKYNIANYNLEKTTINLEQAEEMFEREEKLEDGLTNFTLWTQLEQQGFVNENLGRSVNTTTLIIDGTSEWLFSNDTVLSKGDESGCLISPSVSFALFGDANVVDQDIKYGERTLTVRGIVHTDDSLVVVGAVPVKKPLQQPTAQAAQAASTLTNEGDTADSGTLFNQISVYSPMENPVTRQEQLRQFEDRHNLGDSAATQTDFGTYTAVARFSALLVPFIVFIIIIFKGISCMVKSSRKPFIALIYLGITAAAVIMYIVLSEFKFHIPENFIPNKWSDFSFWSNLFETQANQIKNVFYTAKLMPELSYFEPMIKAILYGLGATVLFFVSIMRLELVDFKYCYIWIVLGLVMGFVVIIYLRNQDAALMNDKLLWMIYPFYFAGFYMFSSFEEEVLSVDTEDEKP